MYIKGRANVAALLFYIYRKYIPFLHLASGKAYMRGKGNTAVAGNYVYYNGVAGGQHQAAFKGFTAAGGADQRQYYQGRGGRAALLTYVGMRYRAAGAGFHTVILVAKAVVPAAGSVGYLCMRLGGRTAYLNIYQA